MGMPTDFRPDLPPARRARLWAARMRGAAQATRIDAKHPGAGAQVREILARRGA